MKRKTSFLTTSFLMMFLVGLAWPLSGTAQIASDASYPPLGEQPLTDPKWIEGKVADVEPVATTVMLVRLDDGTQLAVPSASRAPVSDVTVGTPVGARYVETMSGKVAVLLRALPEVQSP